MEFGSDELKRFGDYIRNLHEKLKDEDFDITSARIVSKIKPLGLKKPLIAYVVYRAFFTVNISQQLPTVAKLYKNLMKKYPLPYPDSSPSTPSSKPSSILSTSSLRRTRTKTSPSTCQPFCLTSSKRGFFLKNCFSSGRRRRSRTSTRTTSSMQPEMSSSKKW